jgi:regulator of protease activity HflC (stomatin/prohibitin superfamily)
VEKVITVQINSFWHRPAVSQVPGQKPFVGPKLNPLLDGYCITRGEQQTEIKTGSAGGDYGIVHSRWQLTYQIDGPEEFFKNVYVEQVKPGQIYFDVITESISPFLKALFEDSVVTAMVNFTIDEAISSQAKIRTEVQNLLQGKLDDMGSGIKVVSVQLTNITWPLQVDAAFQASHDASSESAKLVSKAKGYAETILSEAAGPRARAIHASLSDETMGAEEKELLWSGLAGQAQERIAEARAYKTKVVENARANAEYLNKILPEYRERPELFVQEVYQDAIEEILGSADVKVLVQPAEGGKGTQFWILVDKDPKAKPKSGEK